MSKKTLQKHCRITQWVEAKDPALADAIRDLCFEGSLAAGRSGVTFLYPGKEVRAEIVNKAYGPAPEEASRILQAHTVLACLRTPAEFAAGEVVTRAGFRLEVEGQAKGAVSLKGGAKLEPSDFRALGDKNLAVWNVGGGRVPLDGPAAAARAPARPPRGPRKDATGGAEAPPGGGRRAAYAMGVEQAYRAALAAGSPVDPFLTATVSLLNFLKARRPDLFAAVMPLADRDPLVCFYLIFEPYKTRGACLVGDDVLFGPDGWQGAEMFSNAVADFRALFESPPPGAETALAFADPGRVRSLVDGVRVRVVGEGAALDKASTPAAVVQAYERLARGNAVDGAGNILPPATLSLLAAGGDPAARKLWQDELRFVTGANAADLRGKPYAAVASQVDELFAHLRTQSPGDDYARERVVTNPATYGAGIQSGDMFTLLVKFVNSTAFLYTPVPESKIGGDWDDIPVEDGDDVDVYGGAVYNCETGKSRYLGGLARRGGDVAGDSLPPAVVAQVRSYVDIHGELPKEIRDLVG